MKRIAMVVLAVAMIAVMLFAGCGVSQSDVDKQVEAARTAGYNDGYGEVAERIGLPADASVGEVEANLEELVTRPEPLHNPTYAELMGFLAEDETEEGNYDSHITYTLLFLKEAAAKKIQGYPVVVTLITDRVLVFAGFETSDQGWVYVLPALDTQVNLEVGKSYREINGGSSPFGPHDDAILSTMIFGGEFLNEETTAEAIREARGKPIVVCD